VIISFGPNKLSALRRIVGSVSWYSIIKPFIGMGVVIKLSIRLKVLKSDIKILRYWDIGHCDI
jgi:hypothetical protein